MKRIAIAALAVLLLAGCGNPEPEPPYTEPVDEVWEPEVHYVFDQELPDGRTVQCVWAHVWGYQGAAGGISCDWDGAK